MDLAAEMDRHRRHLVDVAYRLLGSVHDAEDVVQEAFVRADRAQQAGGEEIDEPKAWLTRIVSRLALDQLKSARVRRERYVGPWLPEPLITAADPVDPAGRVTLDEQITFAVLTVLETLSPAERAVYVLHEAFGIPLSEVAAIVGRTPAACRQLAARARRHVAERAPRFDPDPAEQTRVVTAFQRAAESGDIDALAGLLDENVAFHVDSGGVVPGTAVRPIVGRDRVSRQLGSGLRSATDLAITPVTVNGQPGLVARYDGLVVVFAVVVHDGRITHIDAVANPAKLPANL